jgi:hypothetical protein
VLRVHLLLRELHEDDVAWLPPPRFLTVTRQRHGNRHRVPSTAQHSHERSRTHEPPAAGTWACGHANCDAQRVSAVTTDQRSSLCPPTLPSDPTMHRMDGKFWRTSVSEDRPIVSIALTHHEHGGRASPHSALSLTTEGYRTPS